MLLFDLMNGTSIVIRISDIKKMISHGDKTLVYIFGNNEPLCANVKMGNICELLRDVTIINCHSPH